MLPHVISNKTQNSNIFDKTPQEYNLNCKLKPKQI